MLLPKITCYLETLDDHDNWQLTTDLEIPPDIDIHQALVGGYDDESSAKTIDFLWGAPPDASYEVYQEMAFDPDSANKAHAYLDEIEDAPELAGLTQAINAEHARIIFWISPYRTEEAQ